MDPDLLVIFGSITTMVIGVPIARAIGKRITAKAEQTQMELPSDLSARLARIEQITEATQIEVERLAEGQRFTTKLLSERVDTNPPRPKP
jgi:hypothetical protein